jgi:NitT/TauT family transport system substrate-binding protein
MARKLKQYLRTAVAFSLGLVLASGTAQAQTPLSSPSPSTQWQQALLPISIALGDVSLTKLPLIIAYDNGLFTKNGLKADMYITPYAAAAVRGSGVIVPPQNISKGGPPADISITGGAFNVVNMTTVATYPARTIIATMDNVVRFHVIVRADIKTLADLKGKRIGYTVPGALEQYSMLLLLKTLHIDPVHDVSMYQGGGNVGAIEKGQVDAFAGDEIAIDAAKKAGLNDLVDLRTYNWPMPGSSVLVLSSWLPQHRVETMQFMKSILEAVALMKTNRQVADASLTKWFGITDPTKLATMYASAQNLPDKPYPSLAGLKLMRTVYDYRALDITKPEDFVDASFITTLDKSGFIDNLYKIQKGN